MYAQILLGLLLVLVSIPVSTAAAATPCYFPSGDLAPGNVPCNNGTEFSSCCSSASTCLANGLCLVNNDNDTVEFGRGGCTDQTWGSENCFQYCRTTSTGEAMSNGAAVFECDTVGYDNPANYCCEAGTNEKSSCCATPSLRFLVGAGLPIGTQTIGSSTFNPATFLHTSTSSPPSSTSSAAVTTSTSSSQQTTSSAAATSSGSSGNERLHDTTSSSATNGQASITTSTTRAAAESQTSSVSSANIAPSITPSNETMVIVIGVTVPVFVLFTALVGFLIWNNRRNSREIRSLKDGIRYGPSNSSLSHLSSPTDYKPAINLEKTLPGYPQPLWRSEYYKPYQTTGSRPATRGNGRAYELPHAQDPQELDSANIVEERSTV